MTAFWRQPWAHRRIARAIFDAPLAPNTPFYVVGDVHGCMTEMSSIFARLDPELPVVMVGDYVDRGPRTPDVLETLFARKDDPQLICLSGNHEVMLLSFLDDPAKYGRRWLRYGGVQTLASYGIRDVTPSSSIDAQTAAAQALQMAMGPELVAWMRGLPLIWQSGNVAVVHAAADPSLPIDAQNLNALCWGHKDFATIPRTDGLWVVHGHTVVEEPVVEAGRISIDTGAYTTGNLTAARIATTGVTFLKANTGTL